MKYLKLFIKEHKGKTAINIALILVQAIGTLLLPFLIAAIVDDGILKGSMESVIKIGIIMLIVAILSAAVGVFSSWYSADFAAMFGRDMRLKLFTKSQDLSLKEFNEIGLSSMVTRSTADISTMQSTVGLVLQLMVPAPLLAVASVIMTINASPQLALILLISIALFLTFAIIILKASGPISRIIQKKLDRINQLVRESITGTRVIRAFGNEEYEENRSGEAFGDYAKTIIKLNRMFAVANPVVWLIIGLSMAAILWFGGLLVGGGSMEVGKITAVSEYAIITLSYLIMAASIAVTLPKMRSCLNRLQEVLDIEPSICDNKASNEIKADKSSNEAVVSFENVLFSYSGAEEAVLQDLSFSCCKGTTTAIIGGTGSGKSTVADLLLRLHDINGGAIKLHGVDIRDVSQKKLREVIGYVQQKAFLFSGTIAQNLRMGNETATDDELWEALKVAQADSFVSNLPLKLDAPVAQGGTNFSGGQKQRLAIARALVRKAEVYVFDDSFSALDVKTDAALRKSLLSYNTNSAKLIIAQRVSTILNADQIIVLDEGRVVGCGRHDELIKSCEVYQGVVKSQMEQKGA